MAGRRPPSSDAIAGALEEAEKTATMHAAEEPTWMACDVGEASGHPPESQSSSGYNPTNAATRTVSTVRCARGKGDMAAGL